MTLDTPLASQSLQAASFAPVRDVTVCGHLKHQQTDVADTMSVRQVLSDSLCTPQPSESDVRL